jgi:hypothetical protein
MLKSEIDQLIELYEIEKQNLETFIKECIPEWEYLLAHYYSRALRDINKRLQTLNRLIDPLFDTKSTLVSSRLFYEKMLEGANNSDLAKYYNSKIEEIDKQLLELKSSKIRKSIDGQELDDAIYDIIEGRINRFRFHLIKEANFYLEFTLRTQNMLIISLTPNNQVTDEDILTKSKLQSLAGLGFNFNGDFECLENIVDLRTFRNSISIKTLISRVIFDIYYNGFDNPTFIEYFRLTN